MNLVGLDPAAVSRAVRLLEGRGLVAPVQGRFAGRTTPYELTEQGVALFNSIRKMALERETILLQDLRPEEREQFLFLLRKVHGRLKDIQAKAG